MNITEIFALIGVITSILLLIGLVWAVMSASSIWIEHRIYLYKCKHKFDKPPTAKCYCIDCIRRDENKCCSNFDGWCTADDWFCWNAKPRKKG